MSCSGCPSSSPYNFQLSYLYPSGCTDCSPGASSAIITYSGPALSCLQVASGDSLEVVLQKIDEKVCATTGSYSGFNFHCLSGITNEQSFVEGISSYACTLRSDLDTFTGTTYVADQNALKGRVTALEAPNITGCSTYLSFNSGDTMQQVLNKLAAKVCSIHNTELNISSVTWDNCLTVGNIPTTIPAALQLLADQVCAIQGAGGGAVLPRFNNTGSCLPSPGSSDSLVDTVGKIKTRLCTAPSFDINALTWGCTAKPSSTTTDLQSAFQAVLDTTNDYVQHKLTFSADFVVTQTNSGNACGGKTITLATPLNQDKKVASNSSDTSPGYLSDKLIAGIGVTLDYSTTPGGVIINSSGSGADKLVGVISGDTPGYLSDKITGGSSDGITISPTISGSTVLLSPSINFTTLVGLILDEIEANDALKARFCQIMASCPSPCSSPNNVQAVVVS